LAGCTNKASCRKYKGTHSTILHKYKENWDKERREIKEKKTLLVGINPNSTKSVKDEVTQRRKEP